jgi:single-strand DNA-binding protein
VARIEATGNLGGDATVNFTQSGHPVMNFSMCDSKSKKDAQGNWETVKEQWLRVTVWGDYAQYLAEKISKGSRVTVWGEFYAEEFDRKDGTKGTGLSVTADAVKVWPPKQNNNGGNQGSFGQPQQPQGGQFQPAQGFQQTYNGQAVQQPQQPSNGGWGGQPAEPPF